MAHHLPNADVLERLVAQGKVRQKFSDRYPALAIYKYSPSFQSQFFTDEDAHWVRWCRGLVYDHDADRVVCCPMPKFFGHQTFTHATLWEMVQENNYTVSRKVDGSCVLVWYYDGTWQFTTLFSFDSEQAMVAKHMALEMGVGDDIFNKGSTQIFEVVYPENHIIVDYGEETSLTYITSFDNDTGREYLDESYMGSESPIGMVGQHCPHLTLGELHRLVETQFDVEGYVLTHYPENAKFAVRVKFKTSWYFEQSGFMSRVHAFGLVEACYWSYKNRQSHILAWAEKMDHSFSNVHQQSHMPALDLVHRVKHVHASVNRLVKALHLAASGLGHLPTRKEQALEIQKLRAHHRIKAALFCALDGKDEGVISNCWEALRTESEDSIKTTAEAYAALLVKP